MVSSLMLRLTLSLEPGLSVCPGYISRYLTPRAAALSTVSKKVRARRVQHCSDSLMPSFSEAESSRREGASAAAQFRATTNRVRPATTQERDMKESSQLKPRVSYLRRAD